MFFGIVIRMFYQEHEPPHFHEKHHGQRATFDFSETIVAGQMHSRTAKRLIRDWTRLNRQELENNWRRIKSGEGLERIPPLE
ncbi:MAG: DUF4160 domain-containing protein [Acidobacteria bacterium]|nr:DUF4160 domain-containing protein [Acidobacteriota bacterium]